MVAAEACDSDIGASALQCHIEAAAVCHQRFHEEADLVGQTHKNRQNLCEPGCRQIECRHPGACLCGEEGWHVEQAGGKSRHPQTMVTCKRQSEFLQRAD